MKQIHSIYLQGEINPKIGNIPERIRLNIESQKLHHLTHTHTLYTDEETRFFIKKYFDKETLDAYEDLTPLAYKADLARYCILYELGGIYSDLSLHFFCSIFSSADENDLIIFRDNFHECPWYVNNGLISTPAKNSLFYEAINLITANVKMNYYGRCPLSPTGPDLIGKLISKQPSLVNINCGQIIPIGRSTGIANVAFLNRNEQLICVKYKKEVGLSALGGHHNSYSDIWNARKVYKSHTDKALIYDREFIRTKRYMNISSVIDEKCGIYEFKSGIAIFGPYTLLDQGHYSVEYEIQGITSGTLDLIYKIDVTSEHGSIMIAQSEVMSLNLSSVVERIILNFNVKTTSRKVEVRLHLIKSAIFEFKQLKIIKINH
jgi:hypothetical protein